MAKRWGNRGDWEKIAQLQSDQQEKVAGAKPSKMGNRSALSVDGKGFQSGHERDRYEELRLLQMGREIRDLECQVRFDFVIQGVPIKYASGRQAGYIADFRYYDCRREEWVIEDAKGHRTELYKLKKALMAAMGYTITET